MAIPASTKMKPAASPASSAESCKKVASKRRTLKKKRETVKSTKYIHVHQYLDTGRWGSWYNCPMGTRRRLYFGTHLTENLAARAQDRALLKFKPLAKKPIKLNFNEADYASDAKLRATLTNAEFTCLLALEARGSYKKVGATECLEKFVAEEAALGNLPSASGKAVKKVEPLGDYLKRILEKRTSVPAEPPVAPKSSVPGSESSVAAESSVTAECSTLTWIGKRARSGVNYPDGPVLPRSNENLRAPRL